MSRRSNAVTKWRKSTKNKIVEAMGGECVCCGYNKCIESLQLHHVNPSEKEKAISYWLRNPHAWDKIVKEIRKCVLLCANCHSEIHYGVTKIPDDAPTFNEKYANYEQTMGKTCPVCGKKMPSMNITCSKSCAAKTSGKVKWEDVDLPKMLLENNCTGIAEELKISQGSVRKRAIKLGINLKECAIKRSEKVDWESINLRKLLQEKNLCAIGRMLGVSDNAVRKRALKLGLL